MNADEFQEVCRAETMPASLSPELQAMWLIRNDQWEASHDIAQDIPSSDGSWIHALLHLIEGDTGNAGYWFRKAGRPVRGTHETDSLWNEIVAHLLG